MSNTSTTRTITLIQPPKEGKPSVGLVCSHSRISYCKSEAYETDVYVQLNEGSVLVKPSQITLQLAYSSDPTTFYNMNMRQNYGYMKLTRKVISDNSSFHFTFAKGASFRGQLKFTVTYKGVDYYAYLDVTNYTELTTVECEMQTLAYNPADDTHSVLFDAYLTVDGVKVTDYTLTAIWQTKSGDDIIFTPATIGATDFFNGLSISRHQDEMLKLTIQKGATFEGSLQITLNKGDISRSALITIARVLNGKESTRIDCDIAALSYKEGESSNMMFDARLYVDGEPQEDAVWSAWYIPNEGATTQVTSSRFEGLLMTYDDGYFVVFFAHNSTFEGMIRLTLTKGDISRSIQLPVLRIPKGKNGISLETSCDAVVYNNSAAYSKVISFMISDGGEPIDIVLDSIKFNGESVPFYETYEKDGMSLFYNIATHNPVTGIVRPSVLTITFAKGATASGTIEVAETHNGVLYKAEISVTCVEDGENGISLVCSTNAITYNPVLAKSVTISVHVMDGEEQIAPEFLAATFKQSGEQISEVLESSHPIRGLSFAEETSGNRHLITLSFAVDAYVDGEISLLYEYNEITFETQISVTKVENGIPGFNGASPRGPRLWTEVKALHSEPEDTEKFFSGQDGEEWLDIVIVLVDDGEGGQYERYYRPKKTHFVKDSPNPWNGENNTEYWEQSSDTPFVATQLLFAKRAKVDNLVSEGIEMNEDVNGVRKVVFSASKYEENGQTKAVVYASKGKFENVEVIGDIRSNTQTFVTPEFPADDIRMWETDYTTRQPTDIIPIVPQGGCIIAPTGKCSYQILLPSIPSDTARQLIIVNQKMPYTRADGETKVRERSVYLTPDSHYVRVFPSMTEEDSNEVTDGVFNPNNPGTAQPTPNNPGTSESQSDTETSEPQSIELGYGAFMVFAYTAKEYDRSLNREVTYTYWSVWQMSMGESAIIPEPKPFAPKSGSGVEIPMYHQTTLDDLREPSPIG